MTCLHHTRRVYDFNFSCSRLSDSADMTPWEVIEEALLHKRPVRNLQWLADQLGTTIQVVVNWRTRGVPPRRYRDIAAALGLTIDQLEGVKPLPWERQSTELSPQVARIAEDINQLPPPQRDFVLDVVRRTIDAAKVFTQPTQEDVNQRSADEPLSHDAASSKRSSSA